MDENSIGNSSKSLDNVFKVNTQYKKSKNNKTDESSIAQNSSNIKDSKAEEEKTQEILKYGIEKEMSSKALFYVLREGLSPRYGIINYLTPSGNQKTKDPFYSSDEYYMLQLYNILNVSNGALFNESPAKVTDYMYIGGYKDAKNWPNLKDIGITHVINLAAFWEDNSYNPYPRQSSVVAYEAYNAKDSEEYNMMQIYPQVRSFIDRARWTGGKVLVHCAMGINRSGVMCCAYLMDGHKMSFMEAIKRLKQQRGTVLRNRAFQKQLLTFARENGYLDPK